MKESLAAEKTSFKKNIASKEAELKKLQNDFNKQLESVMKSSSQEDPKVNALESQVKQLNSELEKLKTKNADTSKELAAAKERSTKFWKATKRLKAELEEAKKSGNSSSGSSSSASSSKVEAAKNKANEAAALKAKMAALQAKKKATEAAALKAKLAALKAKVANKQK